MITEKHILIETLNENIQRLFDAQKERKAFILNQNFEAAIIVRDQMKTLLQEVLSIKEELQSKKIAIEIFVDQKLLRPINSILIRNFEAFQYYIKHLGLPDKVSMSSHLEEDGVTSYDYAKWLVIHCLENDLILDSEVVLHDKLQPSPILELLNNFSQRLPITKQ